VSNLDEKGCRYRLQRPHGSCPLLQLLQVIVFQALGYRFGHRLPILRSASFVDRVRPHNSIAPGELHRGACLVLSASTTCEKAFDDLRAGRFFLDVYLSHLLPGFHFELGDSSVQIRVRFLKRLDIRLRYQVMARVRHTEPQSFGRSVQTSGEFRESSISRHCIHRQQQEADSMRIVRIEGVPPTGDVVTDIGVEQRVIHTLSGVVFEMTSKRANGH
jgi:hypothetical protein